MPKSKRTELVIPLDRIFLDQKNPRHEPYDNQAQVIEYLCNNEEVPVLAGDIAKHGLSPLDQFGVIRNDVSEDEDISYIAAEGNRRLCALKLLTDPDLAPPKRRDFFERLSKKWNPITQLSCVVFEDPDDLDIWLKRRHHGLEGGIGQKAWNAEQKSRHSGASSRNRVALHFLDYAEQEKLLSAEDRKNRLTTVQRYLSNPIMRETLGLDNSDPDDIKRNRTEEDFRLLSKKFIDDMLSGKVNSRQNSDSITTYARELSETAGQSRERIEAEPVLSEPEKPTQQRRTKPRKAKQQKNLPWDKEISERLKTLNNWKLQSLYHSLSTIPLQDNTPLLAIGVWSFFETLTAAAGRDSKTDFLSFLPKDKLTNVYKLGTRERVNPLWDAIQRIQDFGNTTKHHPTSATFNERQLYNDLDSLKIIILNVINEAISQKK